MTTFLLLLMLRSEPISGWNAVIYLTVVFIVILIGLVIGGYIFIRLLAWSINSARDSWHNTASQLGLTIDQNDGAVRKKMVGSYKGYPVTVTFFSIPKSENSSDPAADAEVNFDSELPFSFCLERRENYLHKIYDQIFSDDDLAGLGTDFEMQISDRERMLQLLNSEIPDGERPTLLGDINAAQRNFVRMTISDSTVKLGRRTGKDDVAAIRKTIEKSIYLAERIKSAAKLIATDS